MTLMEPITRHKVVSVEELELVDFRIRVPRILKEKWDENCTRKKISSQDAGAALMDFLLGLPDAIQSAVFGQVDEQTRTAAARWVIEQMASPETRGKKKYPSIPPDKKSPQTPASQLRGSLDKTP